MKVNFKPKLKRICSKEKVYRLVVGLVVLFAAIFLTSLDIFVRYIGIFIGAYLVLTGMFGACLIYAIWRE